MVFVWIGLKPKKKIRMALTITSACVSIFVPYVVGSVVNWLEGAYSTCPKSQVKARQV